MISILFARFHPTRAFNILNFSFLALFFGFVSAGLFLYLGRTSSMTSGRSYASVSLYLILLGALEIARILRATCLYLSMVTLTTLGYGNLVPMTAPVRMFAGLESVTGVLYIAITVARLVALSKNGRQACRAAVIPPDALPQRSAERFDDCGALNSNFAERAVV